MRFPWCSKKYKRTAKEYLFGLSSEKLCGSCGKLSKYNVKALSGVVVAAIIAIVGGPVNDSVLKYGDWFFWLTYTISIVLLIGFYMSPAYLKIDGE